MSYLGLRFNANLNANNIFIDYSNLPDTIQHTFFITIQNQSISALYFKITSFISNWTVTSPTDGKLGSVGSGSTSTFTITISRSKPTTETIDTGYLRVEAYTDSNYTNLAGYVDLNVTIYIEDLENWTDVIINSFDDGTQQGWTLSGGLSIANDRSVEVGGYSIKSPTVSRGTTTCTIYKTITLPNRNKVRICFYKSFSSWNTSTSTGIYTKFSNLSIQINDIKVFDIPLDIITFIHGVYTTINLGWYKFGADLSAYRGQNVTLKIQWNLSSGWDVLNIVSWLDRIVIAGKD